MEGAAGPEEGSPGHPGSGRAPGGRARGTWGRSRGEPCIRAPPGGAGERPPPRPGCPPPEGRGGGPRTPVGRRSPERPAGGGGRWRGIWRTCRADAVESGGSGAPTGGAARRDRTPVASLPQAGAARGTPGPDRGPSPGPCAADRRRVCCADLGSIAFAVSPPAAPAVAGSLPQPPGPGPRAGPPPGGRGPRPPPAVPRPGEPPGYGVPRSCTPPRTPPWSPR